MGILQVQNVHYIYQSKYQKVHAIKGIHFDFQDGKFYAIVGKSGCGKTTLLSLLAGLDLPTEGQVIYDGKSTAERNRDRYRLRAISLVCQNYNLFPLLTVEENVTYPMLLRGVKPEQAGKTVREKLTAVGLDSSYYKRLPAMLSGGEQQRVAIARALAKNPKLLLCDEPTGALDYVTGKAILKLLQDTCRQEGMTVIVITHNTALTPMADRVIHIKNGRVAAMERNSAPTPVEEIEW